MREPEPAGEQRAEDAEYRNHTGQAELSSLAKAANLPSTPNALAAYEELLASTIRQSPEYQERLQQGDVGVIREAFDQVKAVVSEMRRSEAAALTATKDDTKRLPPRPSGGVPGTPPPQPFTVKAGEEVRGATSRLHKMARELGDRLTG